MHQCNKWTQHSSRTHWSLWTTGLGGLVTYFKLITYYLLFALLCSTLSGCPSCQRWLGTAKESPQSGVLSWLRCSGTAVNTHSDHTVHYHQLQCHQLQPQHCQSSDISHAERPTHCSLPVWGPLLYRYTLSLYCLHFYVMHLHQSAYRSSYKWLKLCTIYG